jgi:hypothetical protein
MALPCNSRNRILHLSSPFYSLIDLLQHIGQRFLVADVIGSRYLRNDLARLGIYSQMQLAPGAPLLVAVLQKGCCSFHRLCTLAAACTRAAISTST